VYIFQSTDHFVRVAILLSFLLTVTVCWSREVQRDSCSLRHPYQVKPFHISLVDMFPEFNSLSSVTSLSTLGIARCAIL
jgi:hypothetical protein